MSYQQGQGINQFIPNYVVRSDYLPNTRVVEGNNTQTSQLVIFLFILSSANMKNRKEEEECSPNDLLNLILTVMLPSKSMKVLELTDQSTNSNSAE